MYNTHFLEYLSSLSRKYKLGTRSGEEGGEESSVYFLLPLVYLRSAKRINAREIIRSASLYCFAENKRSHYRKRNASIHSRSKREAFINLLEYKEFSCVLLSRTSLLSCFGGARKKSPDIESQLIPNISFLLLNR